MIVTCPECATRYAVDDAAFKSGGRAVRCAHCSCEWYQIGSNTPNERATDPSAFPMTIDQDPPAKRPEPAARDASRTAAGARSASEHLQAARRSLAGGAEDSRPTFSSARPPKKQDDGFFADEDELERARAALGTSRRSTQPASPAGRAAPAAPEREETQYDAVSARGDAGDRIRPPEPWRGGAVALDGAAARAVDDDIFEDVPDPDIVDPIQAARDVPLVDDLPADDDFSDRDPVDGFDTYDRALTPAVAAAARRETARAGGVSYRTTAFGRTEGALRRPTRSRRRPVASNEAPQEASLEASLEGSQRADSLAREEAAFSPMARDGALRRPSVGEEALFDPTARSGQDGPSAAEADHAMRSRKPSRGRGASRLILAVLVVGGGLFAAYSLGPQFAEIAPSAAPSVEAYRDRVNAVFSNAPEATPGRASGLAFVDYQYDLVERAEGPALEVWGRVANNGGEPVLTPTIEIVSRNAEGEALQRWLAHPEVDKLGVGETARFTSRMMYPLGPVTDVDLYIAPR